MTKRLTVSLLFNEGIKILKAYRSIWLKYLVLELALLLAIWINIFFTAESPLKNPLLLISVFSLAYIAFILDVRWLECLFKKSTCAPVDLHLNRNSGRVLLLATQWVFIQTFVSFVPIFGLFISQWLSGRLMLYPFLSLSGQTNAFKTSWMLTKKQDIVLLLLNFILFIPGLTVQLFYAGDLNTMAKSPFLLLISVALSLGVIFLKSALQYALWEKLAAQDSQLCQ